MLIVGVCQGIQETKVGLPFITTINTLILTGSILDMNTIDPITDITEDNN